MSAPPRLKSIKIQGYRPFKDFSAQLGPLEVIVGANGSGKSSLFEFLRFLRDGMHREIPPEIIPGSIGQRIFHSPGPARFSWEIEFNVPQNHLFTYHGELMGPVGNPQVINESIQQRFSKSVQNGSPKEEEPLIEGEQETMLGPLEGKRKNEFALSMLTSSRISTYPFKLRDDIRDWRFYSPLNIYRDKIRGPVFVEQNPVLHDNAGNLSSLLFYLMTEHQHSFDEVQQILRSTVPSFKGLTVKAYGAPGQVMAFWQEDGIESDLTLADLSDGTLQLICWAVLCLQPNPPSLICIDEPELGLHPRTLPFLAGLLKKASNRTQILLATHSSYFLAQFVPTKSDLSKIAVMRKENGEGKFLKPGDSKVLMDMLDDFGKEEIEALHISDELEYFA